jgi:hypothetical protein
MLSTAVSRVRHKVVGYLALFFALTGGAYAPGPLKTLEGMRRRARGVAFSIALAAVVFLIAAPAHAAPTNVSWPVYIKVQAAPHTENDIRMSYEVLKDARGGFFEHGIFDSAGITTRVTTPPSCYPITRSFPSHPLAGKLVVCPDGTSQEDDSGLVIPGQGEDFRIFLADRADQFSARESIGSFEVHGGSGNDKVYGNNERTVVYDGDTGTTCYYLTEDELYGDRGNDRLYGRLGPDLLSGGPGDDYLNGGKDRPGHPGEKVCDNFPTDRDDTLRGGPGNDVLWAADGDRDQGIDCGPGRGDKAFLDRQDPKPRGCEKVKR